MSTVTYNKFADGLKMMESYLSLNYFLKGRIKLLRASDDRFIFKLRKGVVTRGFDDAAI